MFLVRYFLYAGSALVGLLFLLDWYSPVAPATVASDQMQETSLDKAILRIQSSQKWPEKIVFDTNIPTIAPPAGVVANVPSPPIAKEAGSVNNSVLNAHAKTKPAVKAHTPSRKVAAIRHRMHRFAPAQVGAYPVASAWSPWW